MQFIRRWILHWLFNNSKLISVQAAIPAPTVVKQEQVLQPINELVMNTHQICIFKSLSSNLFYWSDTFNPQGIGPFLTSKEAYSNHLKNKKHRPHPAKVISIKSKFVKTAKVLKFPPNTPKY